MKFEEWRSTLKKETIRTDSIFRHAMRIRNQDLPDRAWRIIFKYCLSQVDQYLLRIVESSGYQWNPRCEKAICQLMDFNYDVGIGIKTEIPPRPGKATMEAYEIFLCQLVEQEKQNSKNIIEETNKQVEKTRARLQASEQLLASIGWAWCETCAKYQKVPHEPHATIDS